MRDNYTYCLNQVLKSEGGYTNDPRDPGGPTNFGITLADYRSYINKSGTAQDVKNMSLHDAQAIYRAKYWNKMNCDNLPSGVDYAVFDYGVNSGISRAIKVYAKFKNKQPVDCINAICDERMSFLRRLGTFSHFGQGWTSRVARVRRQSISLARGNPGIKTAAAAAAGGATLAATPHSYWPYIIGATALVALVTLVIIYYKRKVSK